MIDELASKGIQTLNFYDIVFDRILIDALENLGSPPSSILVLTRNTWLSNDFKRSALNSAVWTLLTAKRKLLKYPDGFFSAYYRVVEAVSPALAWGFLGSEEDLNGFCESLRDEMVSFVRALFQFGEAPKGRETEDEDESSSVYLEAEGDGDGEEEQEDGSDIDDDDLTITPDGEDGERVGSGSAASHMPSAYFGLELTSLEVVAEGIYSNMGILERRLKSLIIDFAAHHNLVGVNDLLKGIPKQQPPLPSLPKRL